MNDKEALRDLSVNEIEKRLNPTLSDRKARLFAVACTRLMAHDFYHRDSYKAIEVAERYADGLASQAELVEVDKIEEIDPHPMAAGKFWPDWAASATTCREDKGFGYMIAHDACHGINQFMPATLPTQLALIQCIAGKTEGSITVEPAWLTSVVLSFAQEIYDERAYDRMPVLADALQDAGCENEQIMEHCRHDRIHTRGCWILDLLLGKY